MDTLYRNNNTYIRRRILKWNPTTRKEEPYTTGSAPNGFYAPAKASTFAQKFTNCGGAMTHVGDGWWEVLVLGSDMMAALTVGAIIYERVVLDTAQLDDNEPVKVGEDRKPNA